MKKFYGKEHWYLLKRATKQWHMAVSRKNKTILGRLGFAGLLMFAPVKAFSSVDFTVDGLNYTAFDISQIAWVEKYGYEKYSGDIVIPATVTYDSKTYTVTKIASMSFQNCFDLTSIVIPESVTTIGMQTFMNCTSLTSIELPKGLTDLDVSCFSGCSNLESAIMPEGLTTIPGMTFSGCKLTSFTIPQSVVTIGNSAFKKCEFTSIDIPDGVTDIGDGVFFSCKKLTSITIPASVKSIGSQAFGYNTALTSVVIQEGCTRIGANAFENTANLKSITIPSSCTSIGAEAFIESGLQSVTISEGVKTIGDKAFYNVPMTSIVIPASVSEIGTRVFSRSKIENIEVDEENAVYRSIDGALYDKGITTLITCPPNRTDDLEIPESVTTIGAYAFDFCNLSSITIPSSVSKIENNAFDGIYWGNDTKIYCNWQEPIECTEPFSNSDNIYSATLYVPKGTKSKYEAVEPWKNFKNIVEMTTTGIENVLASQNGQPEVSVDDGVIMVNGVDAATTVTVYDMQGRAVYSGTGCATVNLPAGLYIVSVGAHTAKVVLR